MILDLINNDGLEPRRVAGTNGGEYSSPCPACGGDDRFRAWPENDRYWCRQCGQSGDAIQYLIDFHGMSFKDAAAQVGKVISNESYPARKTNRVSPPKPKQEPPARTWTEKAASLVNYAHAELLANNDVLTWLLNERGINTLAVKRFKLGWLDKDHFPLRKNWGLPDKGDGEKVVKRLLVPSGLVIPCHDKGKVIRIRIRRNKPASMGKYYILPGSTVAPMVCEAISAKTDPAIVVESELDAILMSQVIKPPYTIIAMGSAQAKPHDELAQLLRKCPYLVISLDCDDAGNHATTYWLENFQNAVWFPMPEEYGKDPTEACMNGLDLDDWFKAACIDIERLGETGTFTVN